MAKRASFTKSTAAPIDPKVFPSTIDTTIFLSPYIPSEIKNIIPLLHQLPTNQIRTILTDVITYIKSDNNAVNQLRFFFYLKLNLRLLFNFYKNKFLSLIEKIS